MVYRAFSVQVVFSTIPKQFVSASAGTLTACTEILINSYEGCSIVVLTCKIQSTGSLVSSLLALISVAQDNFVEDPAME